MLDTLRLRSPFIGEWEAQQIAKSCCLRSCTDLGTGEMIYELTSGKLEGSYDSSISVKIERSDWVRDGRGKKMTKEDTPPYVFVEGSIHKAMLGHNISGGPVLVEPAVRWLISDLEMRLGTSLPPAEYWKVNRIDWAETFDLGNFDAVQEYLHGMNRATYPRRSVFRYGDECVYSKGDITTVKLYHKGLEFYAHDRVRLKKAGVPQETIQSLIDTAHRLLRVEVELRARALTGEYGHEPPIWEIDEAFLEHVYERDVKRLIKEGECDMQVVRTHMEVVRRLDTCCDSQLANSLYATWSQFANFGEQVARKRMSRARYFRHKRLLQEFGISWRAGDMREVESTVIPKGFIPLCSDPRRLTEQAPEVEEKIAAFLPLCIRHNESSEPILSTT